MATNVAGERYTYSETTTQARSVIPEVDLMSPGEAPFLKRISGGADNKPSLNSLSEPCRSMKFEWIETEDPPLSFTLAGAITDGTDATITVAAADGLWIVQGMVVQIDDEQIIIGATSGTTTPAVSKRGHGGTTAVGHANLSTCYVVGRAHLEGADAYADASAYPTMPYNYVQEVEATILLSELEQAIDRYGVDDALDDATLQKTRQLIRLMERSCFYGKRVLSASSTIGTYGGLKVFIPSAQQIPLFGAGLERADLEGLMQTIYLNVGMSRMPDTIVCGPNVRRRINTIYSSGNVSVYRDQKERRGGVMVDVIDTPFGPLDILLTDLCPADDLYLLRMDRLGFGPMQGKALTRTMLAKTGTADKWMLSGSYTLQVRASKCHGVLTGINTAIL